ncbi:MAG: hypothetical protein V1811_02535 [Candidatus Micrarchaeota archaeon]
MVLFEASLLGLVLVGAVDVYAYKKYRDSHAVMQSSSGKEVSEGVKRLADAVNAESTILPRKGFSEHARKQVELLASHSQPSDASLIVQDTAMVGEVPLLNEDFQPEFTAEEAVVDVTEETDGGVSVVSASEETESDESPDVEETGFDAEKASVDLSNEIGELRKELSSVKKELFLLKKKKR